MILEKGKTIDESIINLWVWESHISELIKKSLKEWETFLDLGANIGYMSLLASIIVGENWKVLSFEPSKTNFQKLNQNISLNKILNITPYNYGVWNKNSIETLFYKTNNPGGSSIVNVGQNKNTIQEEIEIIKLDDFIKDEQINFIKMDIEWFEYFAIEWMLWILKNDKDIKMIFEYSPYYYKGIYGKDYEKKSIELLDTLIEVWFELYEINYKWNLVIINNHIGFFHKINWSWAGQVDIFCKK